MGQLIKQNKYFDRELSWIEFNARVLAEGMRDDLPLLERLKFLGIVSSNFDEFFMVRVAGMNDEDSTYQDVYARAFEVMAQRDNYFAQILVPALQEAGIRRVGPKELSPPQMEYIKNLYDQEISSVLTPIGIREEHPIPVLVNGAVYWVVELKDTEGGEQTQFAVVEVPKIMPRLISLPADKGYAFILIEDVIALFANSLFSGFEIVSQGLMRLTRGAELSLDEEKDEDFAKVMTEALRERLHSFIVRFESSLPDKILNYFQKKLNVPSWRVYKTETWMDLKAVSLLNFQPGFEELKRPKWSPQSVEEFDDAESIWHTLRDKDVLVHHPYESFDAVLKFIRAAAQDPDVIAIKQTLYRTAYPSGVIQALAYAAENGKQVTALVELKARFDEERNIDQAQRLEGVGATVLYGVANYKTHAKATLVVRREPDGIRRYVHLATGNYNEKTGALYSDLGLFTSDEAMTRDVASFFNVITGYSHPVGFSKITISPFSLRRQLERLILREGMRKNKEAPGFIMAKMNSLVDPDIIEALYRASQQGVKIKLNVRGICCLRPGVPGLSENIEVVSIVDMFLEHSRILYFSNGGDGEIYLSSADWMPRNLNKRLEIMFPIENPKLKKELTKLLELYFKDNQQSWRLNADGSYERLMSGDAKPFSVQAHLCKEMQSRHRTLKEAVDVDIKPQTPKKVNQ